MNLQNQIEYLQKVDGVDMFDGCTVPAGLDMERVRGAIVMRCGLLTPLYSEPMTQRMATSQFFGENQWNFEHLLKIVQAQYSPIENVFEDRTETERIDRTHQDSGQYQKTTTDAMETERTISAENVSLYSPDNKTTESGGGTDAGSDSRSGKNDEARSLTMHRNGNIGVTSAESLINEELDLIERFNPYKFIADLYEKQLIIGLY